MRNLLLTIAAAVTALFASADAPKGYYNGISGLKDAALKNKLYEIVSKHSTNSYSGLFKESFCYTDVRPDGTWWDMYSNIKRYVRSGWSGMNREHSFPKSWWGGDTEVGAYTDLNHLYPSDATANSAKLNYPLGEVSPSGITFDNDLVMVGNPVSGQGGGSKYVFEPADEYKGDFARTYFYMVTCYQNLDWKYEYMAQKGSYPSMQGWAVEMLLKWHRQDPVSDKERNRNDEVYKLQSNRNPFIDYPDLVEYIWGSMKGKPYTDEDLPPIGDGLLIAPVNNSTVNFGEVVYGDRVTLEMPIRGNLSANLSMTVYGNNAADFSIPSTSASWSEVNAGNYNLKITFEPKGLGERSTKLLLYDGGLTGVTSYVVNLVGTAVEAPVFDRVEATAATNISSTGFRINWIMPSRPASIDCFRINLTEYVNGTPTCMTLYTDGSEDSFYDFGEAKSGATYSYTIQTVRLNRMSDESNVITVDPAGVNGIEATEPLAVLPIGNGIYFRCAVAHTNVRIIDMTGRVIKVIDSVSEGHCELLPYGAYMVYSDQCRRPIKVLVKD